MDGSAKSRVIGRQIIHTDSFVDSHHSLPYLIIVNLLYVSQELTETYETRLPRNIICRPNVITCGLLQTVVSLHNNGTSLLIIDLLDMLNKSRDSSSMPLISTWYFKHHATRFLNAASASARRERSLMAASPQQCSNVPPATRCRSRYRSGPALPLRCQPRHRLPSSRTPRSVVYFLVPCFVDRPARTA